ncbi:hypothetical protein ES702_06783 [subsurface metagenome]
MENLKNKSSSINGRERVRSSIKTDKFSSIPKVTRHLKGRNNETSKQKTSGDHQRHYRVESSGAKHGGDEF